MRHNQSDSTLETAYPHLDQISFTIDANTFEKFKVLIDQPLPATDKLRRLLKTEAPWDR